MTSDYDLFRQTIGKVQAIKQDKVALHEQRKAKPIPHFKSVMVDVETHLTLPNSNEVAAVGIYDSIQFLSEGLQNNVLKKLQRGFFGVDAEIDLHGLNIHEAKRQLLHFLHNSIEEGYRCVHIVHGKGYRSFENLPVIKNELNHWLRQHKYVQAFCSANAKSGGTGALFVLLKLSDKHS